MSSVFHVRSANRGRITSLGRGVNQLESELKAGIEEDLRRLSLSSLSQPEVAE